MKKIFFVLLCISLAVTIFLVWYCIVAPIIYATEVSATMYILLMTWILITIKNIRNFKRVK